MNKPAKIFTYLKMSVKAIIRSPSMQTLGDAIKYFPAWWGKLIPGKNSVADTMPWLAFGAIDFIKKIVKPEMLVFEYGSGGSTLFWSGRVAKVVSIEHDKLWFEKMTTEFAERKIGNVEYRLIEAVHDSSAPVKSFANPAHFVSADPEFAGKNFEAYVKQMDRFPDQTFDIIVVDGRARPSCILHSIRKLKTGGYLIVDNTERQYYLTPFHFQKKEWNTWKFYGPVPYIYHFSETSIFQKKN